MVTDIIAGAQVTVTRGTHKLDPFLFTNGVLAVAPIKPVQPLTIDALAALPPPEE